MGGTNLSSLIRILSILLIRRHPDLNWG
uniref:Uncharacterized protein n=1 Tax=Arundo donax TaxID=35708 RepID=A0A0A9CA28_ARUDO